MQEAETRCRRVSVPIMLLALGVLFAGPTPATAASADFTFKTTPSTRPHARRILHFARDWQRELCDGLGLPAPQTQAPVEIELGGPQAVGNSIDHAVLRTRNGFFGIVRIPDPNVIQMDDLRFALTAVTVRTALYNYSKNGIAVTEPPVWFVRGIARHGDRNRRGTDFELAYALWSCARLPGAGVLWRADASPAWNHPEVAAQLVAFCGSRSDRRERWRAWCRHLGAGGAWEAPVLAQIWNDDPDLVALDDVWDLWMIARTRRVFDVGRTSVGAVRRFRSLLLLYPWECGIDNPEIVRAGTPLAWCIGNSGSAGLRQAASAKARQLALQGAGRDPVFQAMTDAYADVMRRLAEGASAEELDRLWNEAEARRRAIEADVAEGGGPSTGQPRMAEKDSSGR
jgi:hypothetical protein